MQITNILRIFPANISYASMIATVGGTNRNAIFAKMKSAVASIVLGFIIPVSNNTNNKIIASTLPGITPSIKIEIPCPTTQIKNIIANCFKYLMLHESFL